VQGSQKAYSFLGKGEARKRADDFFAARILNQIPSAEPSWCSFSLSYTSFPKILLAIKYLLSIGMCSIG